MSTLSPVEKLLMQCASQLYQAIGHDFCNEDEMWDAEEVASVLQDRLYDWLLEEEGVSTGLPFAWSELTADRKLAICIAAL